MLRLPCHLGAARAEKSGADPALESSGVPAAYQVLGFELAQAGACGRSFSATRADDPTTEYVVWSSHRKLQHHDSHTTSTSHTIKHSHTQARPGGRDNNNNKNDDDDNDTMLGTKTLLTPFSSLLRNINHAAPINQQESKRVLDALTTSFRKNLDKEHGGSSEDTSSSPKKRQSSSLRGRATDRHVRAILSNPLFSYDSTKPVPNPSSRASDPMVTFDRAVAKGLMTPRRAVGILLALRSVARGLSHVSDTSPGVALRIVQWLRSSGLERDLSFVPYTVFLFTLVPVMVEEGLEEIAWTWLERWLRGEGPVLEYNARIESASQLLNTLIRSKIVPLKSLDRGYLTMVRADDMFSHISTFKDAAAAPWQLLSWQTTYLGEGRPQPSEALFESFAAISQHCTWRNTPDVFLHLGHLDLFHPTHPNPTLALGYLSSSQPGILEKRLKLDLERGQPSPIYFIQKLRKMIRLITDTARHLAQNGRETDAELMCGFLLRFQNIKSEHDLHAIPT